MLDPLKKILLSHPTGNQNVRALLAALRSADVLDAFATCIHTPRGRRWPFLPRGLQAELNRRQFEAGGERIITRPFREIARLASQKLRLARLTRGDSAPLSVYTIYRDFDAFVARKLGENPAVDAVYCYDDGALQTFRAARERGIKCIYEIPTAHWTVWSHIYAEERELQPAWASTIAIPVIEETKKLNKAAELALADLVVCACSFARDGISRAAPSGVQIQMVPYGAPESEPRSNWGRGPLKVLFVGGLTQKKGLSYLAEAVALAGVELEVTVVGRPAARDCAPLNRFLGQCNWYESKPHGEILDLMRQTDVLVLPSLSEGFGLVILEAMSRGAVVIATTHTGGPDVITDGVDGYIVPVRNATEIARRFVHLSENRERVAEMGQAAQATAARYSWQKYGDALVAWLLERI